jgi:hypothetical protein
MIGRYASVQGSGDGKTRMLGCHADACLRTTPSMATVLNEPFFFSSWPDQVHGCLVELWLESRTASQRLLSSDAAENRDLRRTLTQRHDVDGRNKSGHDGKKKSNPTKIVMPRRRAPHAFAWLRGIHESRHLNRIDVNRTAADLFQPSTSGRVPCLGRFAPCLPSGACRTSASLNQTTEGSLVG